MRIADLPSVADWWDATVSVAHDTVSTVLEQHTPGARLALSLAVVVVALCAAAAASRLGTDPEAPFDLERG